MPSGWNRNGRVYGGYGFSAKTKAQARRAFPLECNHCRMDGVPLELDHITPTARGGPNTIDNAQWLCTTCHKAKSQQEATEGRRRHRHQHPPQPHPGLKPPSH